MIDSNAQGVAIEEERAVNMSYLAKIQSLAALGYLNWLPDRAYLKMLYRIRVGKRLDLDNPKTFNEKLQWLKLYDRKPEYAAMVDKCLAKRYVAERIGEKYIIPTLAVWDRVEDIDFDVLPEQFVLKCTHDSGGLVICRDKSKLDRRQTMEKIQKWQKTNYYWSGREWPYKNVKPRIIAEKFMANPQDKGPLRDYKYYCFDGEVKFLYISEGLENHATAQISFLTTDWQFAPFERSDYKSFDQLPLKPKSFDEMLVICSALSKGFPFLRVDLYQISDDVYFSELTFSPCGGFIPFKNPEHDAKIGQMLTLPQKN